MLKESTDATARRNALLALGAMGAEAAPAVPAIADALKPGNPPQVRLYAADALAQIGFPRSERALPAVLEVIRKDADPDVRHRCVWVLFKVEDLPAAHAVEPLSATLNETDDATVMVRYEAARILAARLKDQAPDKTADILLHMLGNRSLRVHQGTGAKVRGVGNEAAGGQSVVKDEASGDGRYMAAEALGWLGRKAADRPDVMKALGQVVKDPNAKLCAKAEQAP